MYRPYSPPQRGYQGFNRQPRAHLRLQTTLQNGYRGSPPFRGGFRGPPPPQNLMHGYGHTAKEYWCETCDRDFHSSQQLENHKQEHQKCNIDGCQFVAHPKIVTLHIQMQHSSGLYKKIAKLDNPEEIKKWREERKLRYPTKSNIEKNAAIIQAKIKRGEKMCLKRQRNIQNDSRPDFKQRNKNKNPRNKSLNDGNKNFQPKKARPSKIPKIITEPEERHKLKPFAGIQSLLESSESEDEVGKTSSDFQIDDDEDGMNTETFKTLPVDTFEQPAVCGALSNLICNYGTSDEEDNAELPSSSKKNEPLPLVSISKPPVEGANKCVEGDDNSGPDEVKTTNMEVEPSYDQSNNAITKKESIKQLKRPERQNTWKQNNRFKPKPQSTLLQKLLFREMRQERNIVLQCIRHIVKNNYFEKKACNS